MFQTGLGNFVYLSNLSLVLDHSQFFHLLTMVSLLFSPLLHSFYMQLGWMPILQYLSLMPFPVLVYLFLHLPYSLDDESIVRGVEFLLDMLLYMLHKEKRHMAVLYDPHNHLKEERVLHQLDQDKSIHMHDRSHDDIQYRH